MAVKLYDGWDEDARVSHEYCPFFRVSVEGYPRAIDVYYTGPGYIRDVAEAQQVKDAAQQMALLIDGARAIAEQAGQLIKAARFQGEDAKVLTADVEALAETLRVAGIRLPG